ncbi:glycosyltransferase [Providencia burhodogranariea]|uniref:Galactosyltransferase n=1 Tax=Providencia burhodogranariea DSM 19968 TaxID=1141662 RepID=K8W106_9GAMM|nr:glycosyltransferase [Providencia burhodogranariea]EKT54129.1 galactosyltransferase [Providencia burhodogranariea DSM 19968]
MKIAFVITGLGMGGAEKQVCAIADKLAINNDVILISLSNEKIIIKPENINIKLFSLGMKKTPLSFILALKETRKILADYKPDIVHSHMIHANIFSRILRLFIRMPVLVCTAHSKNEGGKLRTLLYRITDNLATISTNVSQEAVDSFISQKATKPGRMIPFYNGIDTDKFHYDANIRKNKRQEINISEETKIILAVGRLTEAKDYPNLLHAFSKLNKSTQPKLLIIGDGEDKNKLLQLADKLNISQYVIWLGIRHDVQDWMSACDLFVLSSAWEGFGLVVAEAMACERLVIGTNAGGVSEVINEYGLLIPTNDSDALSSAIVQYLSLTTHERNIIGANARKHVIDKFSLDKISHEWLKLYTDFLK